jgi:hypothetical protein
MEMVGEAADWPGTLVLAPATCGETPSLSRVIYAPLLLALFPTNGKWFEVRKVIR